MFTSERLVEGETYTRKDLRDIFDIKDATINNGVFPLKGYQSIWLFVTENKTNGSTQYKDLLHENENTLDWDGQVQGRTDDLIINHEKENLELLVFYRKDKKELSNYGFTYKGKFRYVSHTASKPTHFVLHRVNEVLPATEKPIELHIKESPTIYELTLDTEELNSDIEDIALGGSGNRTRTTSWSSGRKISRANLQKAKEKADYVGLQGEAYVNLYLHNLKAKRTIREFEWTASENAISPYDFWISDGIAKILIDVKSTQDEFERALHVSFNELLRMREGPERYDIYRVFNIKESTAQLRIVENIGIWADQVLQVLDCLPQGISSDSISLSPTVLPFGPIIDLGIEDWTEE